MKPKLLTVKEAAALKGISTKAIYAAIAEKKLPRRYIQGNLAVRESDVLEWESLQKKRGRPAGQKMGEEQKQRIAQAQKRRWQNRKQPHPSPPGDEQPGDEQPSSEKIVEQP